MDRAFSPLLILALFFIVLYGVVSFVPGQSQWDEPKPNKDLPTLSFVIEKKHYKKLADKRAEAVQSGFLITSDDDYVPAQIQFNGKTFKTRIRLKGDLTDHLQNDQWSFRVRVRDDEAILGMKKFSVQHPATRGFMAEWWIQKAQQYLGLIYLRYFPVRVKVNGQNIGIYVLEEHFDNILLANNKKREGVIVAFDESINWKQQHQFGSYDVFDLQTHEIVDVRGYDIGKALKDPNYGNQLARARQMLIDLRNKKAKPSEIFEVEDLAKYFALFDLYGGLHAGHHGNMRFYFNPITQKLEPIGFDHDGFQITTLLAAEDQIQTSHLLYERRPLIDIWGDRVLAEAYLAQLEQISTKEFFENLTKFMGDDLYSALAHLKKEFKYDIPLSTLQYNAGVIQKKLMPSNAFHARAENSLKENRLDFSIQMFYTLPVVVTAAYQGKNKIADLDIYLEPKPIGKILEEKKFSKILTKRFDESNPIELEYHVAGTSLRQRQKLEPPLAKNLNWPYVGMVLAPRTQSIEEFNFVNLDRKRNIIRIGSGLLKENLILPPGYTVEIAAGTQLTLGEDVNIVSHSPVQLLGKEESKIHIKGHPESNGGFVVIAQDQQSRVENVIFESLNYPVIKDWRTTGGVTFYGSDVIMNKTLFIGSKAEDALNIIHGEVDLDQVYFKNNQGDAFDCDFCRGKLRRLSFESSGNDGLDVSGSEIEIVNSKFVQSGDKAISVGENSQVKVDTTDISHAKIGVASKDNSRLELRNSYVRNAEICYAVYEKKSEFGPSSALIIGSRFENCQMEYLKDTRSLVLKDRSRMEQLHGSREKDKLKEIKTAL